VPALVDTTIRLLSQEPLAGRLPATALLDVAEILDGAGFACLEVSGGGVFDSAVRRGVESPWERLRALNARTKTPLGLALRGRFLVGSRPVGGDFIRRFVASAAENGIEIFRLHDPLNDVSNLREAGEAIASAGCELDAGLVYGSGHTGQTDVLVEQARKLPELGAARVLLHDPSGSLRPHRAHELVEAIREQSGLPVGLYCQGAGGNALAAGLEAAQAGADRIACAVYPVALTLHRVSGESLAAALAGLGLDTGVDIDALWRASEIVDEQIGDEPVTPLAPRVAVRAAEHKLPAGLVAALDAQLRVYGAGDRIDEVLEELAQIRSETGWPPSQRRSDRFSARRLSSTFSRVRATRSSWTSFRRSWRAGTERRRGRSTRASAARSSSWRASRLPTWLRRTWTSSARRRRGSLRARRNSFCSRSSARTPSLSWKPSATGRGAKRRSRRAASTRPGPSASATSSASCRSPGWRR